MTLSVGRLQRKTRAMSRVLRRCKVSLHNINGTEHLYVRFRYHFVNIYTHPLPKYISSLGSDTEAQSMYI